MYNDDPDKFQPRAGGRRPSLIEDETKKFVFEVTLRQRRRHTMTCSEIRSFIAEEFNRNVSKSWSVTFAQKTQGLKRLRSIALPANRSEYGPDQHIKILTRLIRSLGGVAVHQIGNTDENFQGETKRNLKSAKVVVTSSRDNPEREIGDKYSHAVILPYIWLDGSMTKPTVYIKFFFEIPLQIFQSQFATQIIKRSTWLKTEVASFFAF